MHAINRLSENYQKLQYISYMMPVVSSFVVIVVFFSFNDDVDIVVDVGIGVSILQFSIEIRFSFHLVESSIETPQKANTP